MNEWIRKEHTQASILIIHLQVFIKNKDLHQILVQYTIFSNSIERFFKLGFCINLVRVRSSRKLQEVYVYITLIVPTVW